MKKSFIVLVVAFVLSVASSAWAIYLDLHWNTEGMVGTSYSGFRVSAHDYTNRFVNWSLSGGSLPPGLSLKPLSGTNILEIKGTPRKAGNYSFSITANAGGATVTSPFTITIIDTGGGGIDVPDDPDVPDNPDPGKRKLGGSGGGCEAGFGIIGLMLLGAGLIRKIK